MTGHATADRNGSGCGGGLAPWRLIPAGLAIVAATYGLARYTYGLFVPEIREAFDLSPLWLGVIASGSYAGYLLATLFGSTVSATHGPRLPVVAGGLAASVGMAAIALAPNAWVLAAGVVLAGTSPGLAYPPMSDAVMRLITECEQNRTYAVINAGTSVGVVFSGPVALLAGAEWRVAWLAFAAFALVATVWNARLLPSSPATGAALPPRLTPRWLIRRDSVPLFAGATLFGLVTSVFWTFAVDLLVASGGLAAAQSRLFWILIGAAGLAGGAAGDLVRRFGLRAVLAGATLLVAGATAVLAARPDLAWLAYAAGPAFGAAFILATGLYGIWSVNVFNERPSAGFGATFFLISAGQLVGPTLAGAVADLHGLPAAFWAAAALGLAAVAVGPGHDIRRMTRPGDA